MRPGVPNIRLLLEQIYQDMPVLYWASINFIPTYKGPVWINTGTGHAFTWTSNEHCLLLVGYDDAADEFLFNDPWQNHGVISCPRKLAEQRHAEMGRTRRHGQDPVNFMTESGHDFRSRQSGGGFGSQASAPLYLQNGRKAA
jgi:hypothetical protein